MTRRVTDRLAAMIGDTIEDLAQGDDLSWDVALVQQATGPVGLIFVFLPSGVLGESIQTHAVVENPNMAKPTDLASTLTQMVEMLRKARSEHLSRAAKPTGVLTPGAV